VNAAWWWSWLLAAIGLTGLWLAGSRRAAGWAIGIAVQVLWVAYGLAADQWGFIASAVGYGAVNARNLWRWRSTTDPTPEELHHLMPPPGIGAAVLARALAAAGPAPLHGAETRLDQQRLRKATAEVLRAVADIQYSTTHPDALIPPRDQLRRIAWQIDTGATDPAPKENP
jgi:hypothetical protein